MVQREILGLSRAHEEGHMERRECLEKRELREKQASDTLGRRATPALLVPLDHQAPRGPWLRWYHVVTAP